MEMMVMMSFTLEVICVNTTVERNAQYMVSFKHLVWIKASIGITVRPLIFFIFRFDFQSDVFMNWFELLFLSWQVFTCTWSAVIKIRIGSGTSSILILTCTILATSLCKHRASLRLLTSLFCCSPFDWLVNTRFNLVTSLLNIDSKNTRFNFPFLFCCRSVSAWPLAHLPLIIVLT